MNSIQDEVNRAVQHLVDQLVDLAARAVRERLESAEGAAGRGPDGAYGPRRTAAEIASLSDRIMAHVQAHPGRHIEQINDQLRTTSKDLRLPLHKLVASGRILTKGHGRGTTYYASPSSDESAEHPALPGHSPLTMTSPPPSGLDAASSGADDLRNLASLSRLYGDAEPDPGLGRVLADVLTLSRRLRE